MSDDALHFSGVNGSTGAYLHPDLTLSDAIAAVEPSHGANAADLGLRGTSDEESFGVRRQQLADDLSHAGWGLVVAPGTPPDVLEALEPLCARRREQAGERYKHFELLSDESKAGFLNRHSVGPGPANPKKIPYYLLLVGSPRGISYRFQYELDVEYAVGRVCFETAEQYRCYAETVVRAEDATEDGQRSLCLFGPSHKGDRATELSRSQLLEPLHDELREEADDWAVNAIIGARATKDQLAALLWGAEAPPLLVTAGHGVGFPPGDPLRHDAQGALLCADWRGPPPAAAPVDPATYLSGWDVADNGPVRARVVFAFACYGAGTPDHDDFVHRDGGKSSVVAEGDAFAAHLPQRLLAHPPGGALAFVGHVDRAWSYSFSWPGAGAQTETFTATLLALIDGHRVGHAMEYFATRAGEISGALTGLLYQRDNFNKRIDARELSSLWTANNDARSYVIVGDPAVRATGG
jgi:hypothetical protein